MKVIDWLLRVSNGEIHEDTEFKINGEKIEGIRDLGEYKILSKELLNSTVETIEEDKGIEEIDVLQKILSEDKIEALTKEVRDIEKKLNEIIKVINEMREDK